MLVYIHDVEMLNGLLCRYMRGIVHGSGTHARQEAEEEEEEEEEGKDRERYSRLVIALR